MYIFTLLKGATGLSWILAATMLILVLRAMRTHPIKKGGLLLLGFTLLAIVLTVLSVGLVYLQPQERGVVNSPYVPEGYRSEVLGPGLHFIIPGEVCVRYSIQRETYTMSATAQEGQVKGDDSIPAVTKDGQVVAIEASVMYAVDPNKIIQLHIQWQNRYQNNVVRAVSRGLIRDMVSQYSIEELISTKRAQLEDEITSALAKSFSENDLRLIEFVLRDIKFSDAYAVAVEQKLIAQQQALQAQFIVDIKEQQAEQLRKIAKGRADAAVIKAQGDAEARLIQASAEAKALGEIAVVLKDNPDLLTYQYILKLAPNVQVILLPANSPFILPLNSLPIPQ